jgi:hypothetical protein
MASTPLPSLGGGRVRHRPIIRVRMTAPSGSALTDCVLDTGSDDTVFPAHFATMIGIDLGQAQQQTITLAGRGLMQCRFISLKLTITDGMSETYEWTSIVGFGPISFRYALLGHAGFLQYFNAEFRGYDREVILTTNPSFPGRRI